jgi:hypothetical protein
VSVFGIVEAPQRRAAATALASFQSHSQDRGVDCSKLVCFLFRYTALTLRDEQSIDIILALYSGIQGPCFSHARLFRQDSRLVHNNNIPNFCPIANLHRIDLVCFRLGGDGDDDDNDDDDGHRGEI